MPRFFHVSATAFAPGDVLTPSSERPHQPAAWECLYREDNAWRADYVWLFSSYRDAHSYDPCSFIYEVEAAAERHYVEDCECEQAEGDCQSLDCDMPDQYVAERAVVIGKVG